MQDMNVKDCMLETKMWDFVSKRYPAIATKLLYRFSVKRKLNLDNPQTLTEKMQWLKLNVYKNNEIVERCADKYRVREYLIEKGCSSILNELYGVWTTADEIDWESLPNRFVLKCTHGSGYNYICANKSALDIRAVTKLLNGWLNEKYGTKYCEMIYNNIQPRIIAERVIDTEDGKPPTDYKFFCANGEVKFLYIMQGNDEIQDYYTANWEWLPVSSAGRPNSGNTLLQPEGYKEMLGYASKLSQGFPIVRVDFYYENQRIIFGELTFLTTGGYTKYDPEEYDLIFGEMFPNVKELRV